MRKSSLKILIVDSRGSRTAEPRLRRVGRALGSFVSGVEGYYGVRSAADGGLHDLSAFDLALVHETDARKGDGAFFDSCRDAATPCVLYTGDRTDARAAGDRLLFLSDTDVFAHAEAGAAFLCETGRLSLACWTEGPHAARVEETAELCGPLRQAALFSPNFLSAPLEVALASALERLRASNRNPRFQRVLAKVEAALAEAAKGTTWGECKAAEGRRRLLELLGELPLFVDAGT